MLVLHYTGMQDAKSAITRLCDAKAKVSAHYVIDEAGQVFALVAEESRAWHAGIAHWRGVTDINNISIGIEIVNGGHDFGLHEFPHAQISAVIKLCQDILQRHDISPANIVGHNEIAPNRKLDPGEKFPWEKLARSGIGIWPEPKSQTTIIDLDEAKTCLQAIGYDVQNNDISGEPEHCLLSEFQRRYRPQQVDGLLDQQTSSLLRQIADLTNRHKTD
ncbi:MAG: N-acetylmuramoyl-L-alanine amidase [Robiginitomaculum sp.]|nr:N-acetylmuramoyl-L-alanine amidase [Robiginitomaculum sp.]